MLFPVSEKRAVGEEGSMIYTYLNENCFEVRDTFATVT